MIPKHLIEKRLNTIKDLMNQADIDGALVLKPQNVYYLSGFNPLIQSTPVAVFIPRKGEASLLLHALRYPHADAEAGLVNFAAFGRWGRFGDNAPADIFGTLEVLLSKASPSGVKRFWIEHSHMPVSFYKRLEGLLPHSEFLDMGDKLNSLRSVKSSEEIELIEKAAGIADMGMEAAISAIKPGASEAEVSVQAMTAMQMAWKKQCPQLEPVDFGSAESGVLNALWAYCLSGPRMNMMCDSPKDRRIQNGDLVLVVIWTALNGYHAENERTIAVGPLRKEQRHAFDTILQARKAAADSISPGNPLSVVYQSAAEVMSRNGFGSVLPGRIGHGLGLGAHEPLSFGPSTETRLKEGMVLSFEPAIRIGELGGVQHSDTIVITQDGFRYLTNTQRGFITAGA